MALYITSLNSGSNGNCYYIGNGREAVLIDAGISCRETEKRMQGLGLSMSTVKAIFVSHEHGDHITGVPGIAKKYQVPVYITAPTLAAAKIPLAEELVRSFTPHQPVSIGDLFVTAFPKFHDAADPYSFIVSGNDIRVGVFTDIGHVCTEVSRYFSLCHAAFLEANYCEAMLANGNYPYHLKRRISGNDGHLSNAQALHLFENHRGPQLSHLSLSHLSKNNNTPEVAADTFKGRAAGTQVHVASRYAASPLFRIEKKQAAIAVRKQVKKEKLQLSLF